MRWSEHLLFLNDEELLRDPGVAMDRMARQFPQSRRTGAGRAGRQALPRPGVVSAAPVRPDFDVAQLRCVVQRVGGDVLAAGGYAPDAIAL